MEQFQSSRVITQFLTILIIEVDPILFSHFDNLWILYLYKLQKNYNLKNLDIYCFSVTKYKLKKGYGLL